MPAEPSVWSTLPGLLTGGAAVIVALTGELVHSYRATGGGDELSFVLQTTGGFGANVPVSFVARRVLA